MKKVFVLFYLLFYCTYISASNEDNNRKEPNFKFDFGQMSEKDKKQLIGGVAQAGDYYYLLKTEEKVNTLVIYDKELNFIKEFIFQDIKNKYTDNNVINDDLRFRSIFFADDRILILFDAYELNLGKGLLICQTVSLDGEFIGDYTILDETPQGRIKDTAGFYLSLSEDRSKLMVVQVPSKNLKNEQIDIKIYNQGLLNIANTTLEFDYDFANVSHRQYRVTNDGDVIINFRVKKSRVKKLETNEVYFLQFSKEQSIKGYIFGFDNKKLLAPRLEYDDETGRLICIGSYKKVRKKDADGVYLYEINLKKEEVINESYIDYTSYVYRKLKYSKKVNKPYKRKFPHLEYRYLPTGIIPLNNDEIFFILEATNYKIASLTHPYLSYDAIIGTFDRNGLVKRFEVIKNKEMVRPNERLKVGAKPLKPEFSDDIYIFNHKKNLSVPKKSYLDGYQPVTSPDKSKFLIANYNDKPLEYKIVMDNSIDNYAINIRTIKKIEDNVYLTSYCNDELYGLVLITIEE